MRMSTSLLAHCCHSVLDATLPTENFFNETNHLFRLRRDDPGNHCMPVVWLKMFHRRRPSSFLNLNESMPISEASVDVGKPKTRCCSRPLLTPQECAGVESITSACRARDSELFHFGNQGRAVFCFHFGPRFIAPAGLGRTALDSNNSPLFLTTNNSNKPGGPLFFAPKLTRLD
jgi:hypothetical protein